MCSECLIVGNFKFPASYKIARFSDEGGIIANHGTCLVSIPWVFGEIDNYKSLVAASRYEKAAETRAQKYYQHKLSQTQQISKPRRKASKPSSSKAPAPEDAYNAQSSCGPFVHSQTSTSVTAAVKTLLEINPPQKSASVPKEAPVSAAPVFESLPLPKVRKTRPSMTTNVFGKPVTQRRTASSPIIMDLNMNKPGSLKGLKLDLLEVIKAVGRERKQNIDWLCQYDNSEEPAESVAVGLPLPKVRKSVKSSLPNGSPIAKKRHVSSPIIMDLNMNKPGAIKGLKLDLLEVIKAVGKERNQNIDWLCQPAETCSSTPKTTPEDSPCTKPCNIVTSFEASTSNKPVQELSKPQEQLDAACAAETKDCHKPAATEPEATPSQGIKIDLKDLFAAAAEVKKALANPTPAAEVTPFKGLKPDVNDLFAAFAEEKKSKQVAKVGLEELFAAAAEEKKAATPQKPKIGLNELFAAAAEEKKAATPKIGLNELFAIAAEEKKLKSPVAVASAIPSPKGSPASVLLVGGSTAKTTPKNSPPKAPVALKLDFKSLIAEYTQEQNAKKVVKESRPSSDSSIAWTKHCLSVYGSQEPQPCNAVVEAASRTDNHKTAASELLSLLYSRPKPELVSGEESDDTLLPGDFPFFRHALAEINSATFLPGDFHHFRNVLNQSSTKSYLPGDFPIYRHLMAQQQSTVHLPEDFPIFRRSTATFPYSTPFFPGDFSFFRHTVREDQSTQFYLSDFLDLWKQPATASKKNQQRKQRKEQRKKNPFGTAKIFQRYTSPADTRSPYTFELVFHS